MSADKGPGAATDQPTVIWYEFTTAWLPTLYQLIGQIQEKGKATLVLENIVMSDFKVFEHSGVQPERVENGKVQVSDAGNGL